MSANHLQDLIPALSPSHFVEQNDEFWMTAKTIGEFLGYATPRESILKIYQRHQDVLKEFSVEVKLTSTDGKVYDTRIFNEEGIYLFSMYANTKKARAFQISVAKFLKAERLKKERELRTEYENQLQKVTPPILPQTILPQPPIRLNLSHFTVKDGQLWMAKETLAEFLGVSTTQICNIILPYESLFITYAQNDSYCAEGIYVIAAHCNTDKARNFIAKAVPFFSNLAVRLGAEREREIREQERRKAAETINYKNLSSQNSFSGLSERVKRLENLLNQRGQP
jgi:prophage antirepressor-like protein